MSVLLTDGKPDIKRSVMNRTLVYYKLFRSLKCFDLNYFFAGMLPNSHFFNLDAHGNLSR